MANSLRIEVLLAAIDKATGPFRKIAGGATAVAEAVRKSKLALKELEGHKLDISAYSALRAQLRAIGPQLAQSQVRTQSLTSKLEQQRTAHQKLAGEVTAERLAVQARTKAMFAGGERSAKEIMDLRAREMGLSRLEAAYKESTAALNKDKSALKAAERESRALSDRQTDLNGKLEASKQKLEAAGLSTDKFASRQRELRGELRLASEQILRQEQVVARLQKTQAMASKLKRGGMMATAHGVGAWALKDQFAAPAKTMLAAYAEQETAAAQLRASMMGANGAVSVGYDKILVKAQELGNRLPGTTADLIQMFTMLKRQGMSDQVILGGLGESAAYLGAQLQIPYTEAAEFAAKLQDATRTSEGDMIKLADTIQRAFYLGVDSDNMLAGFVKLSPAMDVLRVRGLEATKVFSPLLVMLDQMGMKGEQSGNALRKVFQKVMDTGGMSDINKMAAPRDAGIRFDFTDGKGEFGGLDKMFKQLEQMRKLNTADRLGVMKAMFGDDAETLQTVAALIDKGQAGYAEIQRKMQAQASLQARVNVGLGTLGALWEAASGTFRNALGAFGEAASPEIKQLTGWLGSMSEKVMAWAKANPQAAAGIVKLSLGAGALLAVLGAILVPVGLLVGAVGHLISGWAAIEGVFVASGIAIGGLATPLLLIAGAGLLIWKFWEPIKAFFGGMWDGFVAGLQPVMPVLGMLGQTLASIFAPAQASEESLSNIANVGQLLGEVLGGLVTWVVVPLGLALQGVAEVVKFVGTRLGEFIGFMVTNAGAVIDIIKGIFTLDGPAIVAGFQAIWVNVNQFFGGLPAKLMQFGINMVQGLVNGILSMLGAPGKALAKVSAGMIGRFKALLGINSPSRLFAQFGGFTMDGFTQGLLGGERGAQGALKRISAGLRVTGAGMALGAAGAVAAAPALPAAVQAPMQQTRVAPALEALSVLPALQARVTPHLDDLPRLQARIDTRPPLAQQGGRSGAGDSHATYNITIHAAPGSDERKIARMVRDELEQLERRRAVRKRSEMSDYE